MEINTVIIVGSLFIILLIIIGVGIIVVAQQKKNTALIKLQGEEVKKQQDIAENTLITQERERQKLGLELHDDLGPIFSAVRLYVQLIKQKVDTKQYEGLDEIATTVNETLNEAIQKFSDVSRVLYPSALKRLGLVQAIDDVVTRCNTAQSSISFIFSTDIKSIDKNLIELTIYRLCQELTNNAIKHSQAQNVKITLSETADDILLEYSDDGVGFDSEQKYDGLGMNSLRGRVDALGGNLYIDSKIKKGTGISAYIPKKRN